MLRAIKSQELGVAVKEKPSPAAISKVVDDCKSCIGDESGEAVAVHISFHVVAGFLDVLDCPQLLVLAKIVVLFILLYMTGTSRGLPHMYQ